LARANEWPFRFAAGQLNYGELAVLVVAMLLGVIASYVYQRASNSGDDDNIALGSLFRAMWTNPRFIMALVVSPLVFNGVLVAIADASLTIAHFLLAFQNGFFWETVIAQPLPKSPTPAREADEVPQ
jgi:hypothetical protein